MLIDTHAHVNFNAFREDWESVIKYALKNNVWMINVGSQYSTSKRAVEIAQRYQEGVYASVALHPIHLKNKRIKEGIDEFEEIEFLTREEEFNYENYKKLAQGPKVVAIGETGLDYYHIKAENQGGIEKIKNLQKEVFLKHLGLAKELDKPVIIHCRNSINKKERKAYEDILEILKQQKDKLIYRGVMHSFSGNWQQARKYREFGFKIGLNGIITFARDYDKVILDTPLQDLLVETDCPYLTPIPYRGKRNEPLYIECIAKKIAEIKEIGFEKVAEITTENARKLFRI